MLYPVDGFLDHNREEVLAARDELAELAKTLLGASVTVGFIDPVSYTHLDVYKRQHRPCGSSFSPRR